jgi:DNA polymerase
MTYHKPRIYPHEQSWRGLGISYEGWNTNPKNGGYGWITKELYSGRIAENITQHVARNIQMNAIENLEAAGYPVVMHTYDEVVCEVPEGFGSVTELESLMTTLPAWAKDWPIKAAGGWEARNYRKG